jgi:hypothetical protein
MTRIVMVGISGVGQRFAPKRTDGIRDLVRRVNELNLEGVSARYSLHTADPGEIAAYIKAQVSGHWGARVVAFGHSHGVETICRAIAKYDAPVYAVVSADGWNGLGQCAKLLIPEVVANVWAYVEDNSWLIHGSRIDLEDYRTQLYTTVVDDVKHAAMDSEPRFVATVMSIAKGEL